MTKEVLPLDNREICAELFRLACEMHDAAMAPGGVSQTTIDWFLMFSELRYQIEDGEGLDHAEAAP